MRSKFSYYCVRAANRFLQNRCHAAATGCLHAETGHAFTRCGVVNPGTAYPDILIWQKFFMIRVAKTVQFAAKGKSASRRNCETMPASVN